MVSFLKRPFRAISRSISPGVSRRSSGESSSVSIQATQSSSLVSVSSAPQTPVHGTLPLLNPVPNPSLPASIDGTQPPSSVIQVAQAPVTPPLQATEPKGALPEVAVPELTLPKIIVPDATATGTTAPKSTVLEEGSPQATAQTKKVLGSDLQSKK